jgi:hypothetical protein
MTDDLPILHLALAGAKATVTQIEEHIARLTGRRGKPRDTGDSEASQPAKRVMNASARKRIAAAQRRRWKAFHASKAAGRTPTKTKRVMTPEGKERIAEATRKRWAEFRAQKAAASKAAKPKPATSKRQVKKDLAAGAGAAG